MTLMLVGEGETEEERSADLSKKITEATENDYVRCGRHRYDAELRPMQGMVKRK